MEMRNRTHFDARNHLDVLAAQLKELEYEAGHQPDDESIQTDINADLDSAVCELRSALHAWQAVHTERDRKAQAKEYAARDAAKA